MLQLTSSLLLLVAVTISPIVANYVIDVKLIKFENFNRLLANRRHCSNFGSLQCQTSLNVCARPDSSTVSCEYGTRETGVIGDNIINLNTSYVGSQRNPMTLVVLQPFQKFIVSFTAKDNQELIDKYDYNSGYNMPHKSIEEASYQMQTTVGQYGTGSQLTYQIRTYCSQGYYGPNCAMKCEIPIIEQVRFMCDNNGQKVCKAGFSGPFCNLNADVCRSSPCKNGATCSVQGSVFRCYCNPGYTGQYCNKGIDECSLTTTPCLNGGTCVDGIGNYSCMCPSGYTGFRCEIEMQPCFFETQPCYNGGTCMNRVNDFICKCVPGFTGNRCQSVLSACLSAPCMNGGKCSNAGTSFMCQCLPNFYGNRCQFEDKCRSVTCLNGGRCATTNFVAKCECLTGFTGTQCQILINSCQTSPCQNGGTCYPNGVQFTCLCPVGFTGQRCEQPFCTPNICQHGGTCQLVNNQITCLCLSGYYGDRCENTTECYSPCQNGGICDVTTRRCNCPQGFLGTDCSIRDACASNPNVCHNSGRCQMVNNQITCICLNGFFGDKCQFSNRCSPRCQNGGTCNLNTRICDCTPEFGGRDCGIRNPCASKPCLNNGQCYVQDTYNYTCTCTYGWTGKNCESLVRTCTTNPCLNGGQCFPMGNNYVCACRQGWTGQRCEFQSDPCTPNPCFNNGRCSRFGTNDFSCSCINGWYGKLCDQKNPAVNCLTNPCRNGGTCLYNANPITCKCPSGFNGNYCEVKIPQMNFTCPMESGLFPDPQSCRHFYQCDWNHSYRKDCPGNLHFNEALQVCDWPMKANCNIGK
ncbi:fibropellin-1 isoform X2 [Octopus bimaculoides]|uniref:fibropellin-1 isoform X2 n=1 Tax=Octopus bimaculoides TaxID=37653 RepID=UPI00071D9DA8|nr:fibropellin-1 isoform X2 [Octopus bimaculoides]|eukprot:XP_014781345.1 PREDICTED: fibropellin-1-like isoform X2 [Octopus bimaculoides]